MRITRIAVFAMVCLFAFSAVGCSQQTTSTQPAQQLLTLEQQGSLVEYSAGVVARLAVGKYGQEFGVNMRAVAIAVDSALAKDTKIDSSQLKPIFAKAIANAKVTDQTKATLTEVFGIVVSIAESNADKVMSVNNLYSSPAVYLARAAVSGIIKST